MCVWLVSDLNCDPPTLTILKKKKIDVFLRLVFEMLTNSEWACTIIRTFIYVQNGIEIIKKKRQTKKK